MYSVTLQEFKKMVNSPEILNRAKQKEINKKMAGLAESRVIRVEDSFDTGGYWLQIARLVKRFKTVKPLLIGKASNKHFSRVHYPIIWDHFQQMNEQLIEKEEGRVELEDYIKEHNGHAGHNTNGENIETMEYINLARVALYAGLNELIRIKQNTLKNIPTLDFPTGWDLNAWDYTDENFDREFTAHSGEAAQNAREEE